jgi:YidC/Oxa1 family membrane protein insertase
VRDTGQERRAFLAIVLAMGVLLIWNVLFPPKPVPDRAQEAAPQGEPPPAEHVASGASPEGAAPQGTPAPETSPPMPAASAPASGPVELAWPENAAPPDPVQLHVESEHIHLTIDSRGARVIEVALPRYREAGDREVQLLPQAGAGALASVAVTAAGPLPLEHLPFRLASDTHDGTARRIAWELELRDLFLRKTYVVPDRGDLFRVEHELVRDAIGVRAWGLSWAGGLRHTEQVKGSAAAGYFQGTVLAEGSVQRKNADAARKGPIEYPGNTYFVGVQNKYFLAAIVPKGDHQGPARLWQAPSDDPEHPSVGGEILVERTTALAADRVEYDVYAGPQNYKEIAALGLGLEGALDLGAKWIRPLSRMILAMLIAIDSVVRNYGVTIILFSTAMNLLFFPLTYKSTKSMRQMSALKPKLDALKEKYKDEPQKMSEATMRVYKEAGVNPLAGCLPLLLQMPIFFALYAVLIRTIELRQAPFMLWIHDLSQPDVVFELPFALPFIGSGVCLLPIIMGVTSYFQSKQTMVDPSQKTMMILMPVMMTFIFFTMPSGLVLYWLTSNVFTIASKYFFKAAPVGGEAAAVAPPRRAAKAGARS